LTGTIIRPVRHVELPPKVLLPVPRKNPALAVERAATFPRLRYMGSKYRLVPQLAKVFAEVGGTTALDGFSGSAWWPIR
jgi:hypothetical protein